MDAEVAVAGEIGRVLISHHEDQSLPVQECPERLQVSDHQVEPEVEFSPVQQQGVQDIVLRNVLVLPSRDVFGVRDQPDAHGSLPCGRLHNPRRPVGAENLLQLTCFAAWKKEKSKL